jgi:hypothetical protein
MDIKNSSPYSHTSDLDWIRCGNYPHHFHPYPTHTPPPHHTTPHHTHTTPAPFLYKRLHQYRKLVKAVVSRDFKSILWVIWNTCLSFSRVLWCRLFHEVCLYGWKWVLISNGFGRVRYKTHAGWAGLEVGF